MCLLQFLEWKFWNLFVEVECAVWNRKMGWYVLGSLQSVRSLSQASKIFPGKCVEGIFHLIVLHIKHNLIAFRQQNGWMNDGLKNVLRIRSEVDATARIYCHKFQFVSVIHGVNNSTHDHEYSYLKANAKPNAKNGRSLFSAHRYEMPLKWLHPLLACYMRCSTQFYGIFNDPDGKLLRIIVIKGAKSNFKFIFTYFLRVRGERGGKCQRRTVPKSAMVWEIQAHEWSIWMLKMAST